VVITKVEKEVLIKEESTKTQVPITIIKKENKIPDFD
jgi:hypothetical protein